MAKVLNNINPARVPGPENIPGRLLIKRKLCPKLQSLCTTCSTFAVTGQIPRSVETGKCLSCIQKRWLSASQKLSSDFLLSILSKCFERRVFNHCYPHISSQLYHLQHRLLRGRSTVTHLLQVYHHKVINALTEGKEIDVIYLDFAEAVDKVPHSALINKLSRFGVSDQLRQWFQSSLSNRSQWVVLLCTVPIPTGYKLLLEYLKAILGPLLFLTYINDILHPTWV